MNDTQQEELAHFLAQLLLGTWDEELDSLKTAIVDRYDTVQENQFDDIAVGTLIRFNTRTRPKYLQGAVGVVIQKKQKNVVVRIGEDRGKFLANQPITTSTLLVDIVDQPESS